MQAFNLRSIGLLITVLLVACSPSPEDEKATATQIAANVLATQTAAAPTLTPTATAIQTPTPTATATPTPTAPPTPTPLPGPVTVHLAPDGSGDYSSLEAAVDAVPSGSTLILDPGTYHLVESLEIRRPLRLVGAGLDETEIVSEAEGYVVRFSGDGLFAVEDLTFRHEGEAMADVVVVQSGEVELAYCRVSGAVSIEDERTRVGLRLAGSTMGSVQDCVAEKNNRFGILAQDRAQVLLEGNVCSDNEGVGIAYWNNAGGEARQNQCTGNQFGIVVNDQARPTLEENVSSDNESIGIVYADDAGGVARQNQCTGNETGIFVINQAQPTLEENVCSDNESGGIVYFGSAGGLARRNQVKSNGYADISVLGEAHPTLEGNVCSARGFSSFSLSGGISIDDTANPTLINNNCEIK